MKWLNHHLGTNISSFGRRATGRILGIVATIALAVTLFQPVTARAQFIWSTNSDNTLTLAEYTAGDENVIIPQTVNGQTVSAIGVLAFGGMVNLQSVTIPESVTRIETYAFFVCPNLTTLYFEGNAPALDDLALEDVTATVYHLPGATGWTSFGGLTQKVWIPYIYSVTNNAVTLLEYTNQNGTVIIPDNIDGVPVTSLDAGAFRARTNLTVVNIPATVTQIGVGAFSGNATLTNLLVDSSNPSFLSSSGVLFDKNFSQLIQYPTARIGDYHVPGTVTAIGDFAFAGAVHLTGLYFEGNAPSAGANSFRGVTGAIVYYQRATTGWGYTFHGLATRVWGPPGFDINPQSASAILGQSVNFTASASGGAPIFYQWQLNGESISRATNASLSLANIQATQAGAYSVIAANSYGTATSTVATLTVLMPPSVVISPVSQAVASGGSASLAVTASGDAPLAFQWYGNSAIIADATNATELFSNLQPSQSGSYYVVITNNWGSATSAPCLLTILNPVVLTSRPLDLTVTHGSNVTLQVTATGGGSLSYQWMKDGIALTNGGRFSGVQTPALNINPARLEDQGNYTVSVRNDVSSLTSSKTLLTVSADAPKLAILSPTNRPKTSIPSLTVTGNASDNLGIKAVRVNVSGSAWVTAATTNNWTNWTADVPLSVNGTNWFVAQAEDLDGSTTTASNQVYYTRDTSIPTISIAAPTKSATVTSAALIAKGKASDKLQVAAVYWKLNDGAWTLADGATNWTAAITLKTPGTNTFYAFSRDLTGNSSTTNSVSFFYSVTSPITLQTSGSGTITTSVKGANFLIGYGYTATATPASGWLFKEWTGSVSSTNNPLAFLMQSNMVLKAVFATNIFTPVAGTYSGLFYPSNNLTLSNGGAFTLTLAKAGTFSGALQTPAGKASFSSKFNTDGTVSFPLSNATLGTVQVSLTLDASSRTISGTVTSTLWKAAILAGLPPTSNSVSGSYTVLISGSSDSATSPGGTGAGSATISASGAVKTSITLADGTGISPSPSILSNGQWPLYVSLYSGKGCILAWIQNNAASPAVWLKSPAASSKLYPAGFLAYPEIVVRKYTAPVGTNTAVTWTNGTATATGGNLPAELASQITQLKNKIVSVSGTISNLSLTITPANGTFSGTFTHPATRKSVTVKGAVLQTPVEGSTQTSGGWFLGTNQSGRIVLP